MLASRSVVDRILVSHGFVKNDGRLSGLTTDFSQSSDGQNMENKSFAPLLYIGNITGFYYPVILRIIMNHDKDPYEPTSTMGCLLKGFERCHVFERNQFVPDDYDLASRVGGLQFRLCYWTIQGACQTHAGWRYMVGIQGKIRLWYDFSGRESIQRIFLDPPVSARFFFRKQLGGQRSNEF